MRNTTALLFGLSIFFLSFLSNNFIYSQNKILRQGESNTQSFDENWKFKRFGLQADGTYIAEPEGLESINTNDTDWQNLDLPHDWAITGPFRIELTGETGKLPFKGIGWYRKEFVVPESDSNGKVFIDFDGAMAYAKIWLNGKYVGTWPYGYSSFRFDLTPYLHFGKKNTIAVRLDTEKWDSRWYPGAGIYRHVWLVKTQNIHISHWGTFVSCPIVNKKESSINLNISVQNELNKDVSAVIQTDIFILNPDNSLGKKVKTVISSNLILKATSSSDFDFTFNIKDPLLWDIEHPNRYIAVSKILTKGYKEEIYYTTFGIRSIEFTARNGFLLNGKRVEIKGTCNHHDLGSLGAAMNTSALKRQLNLLKLMGSNALRTSHNPPSPELLELADQMGFLVWDEAFDCWKHGKKKLDYNLLYDEWHEKDLRAMVLRDRNHPSVIIWSIGNEVMDQRDAEMTKHLVDIVKSIDTSRAVSNGYNDPDESRKIGSVVSLDIMGVNYFFDQQPKWDQDPRYANKPTIGSETSSCVSSRGEYFFGKEYENFQITSYDIAKPGWGCTPDKQFQINHKYPHLLGEFVWTGFDYLGEPTPFNSDETNLLNFRNDSTKRIELEQKLEELRKTKAPSRSSYFGIIDMAGFPKDRFYLYQSHWRPELPMAHILPHWNWENKKDSLIPVHVYTSGDEAELFVNGKSYGKKFKKAGEDFRLIWDSVRYEPGLVKVIAFKNGKQWATDQIETSGNARKMELKPDNASINSSENELAFISIKILDSLGRFVPNANVLIHLSISGPGEIIATDNGDPTSFTSFQSTEKETFNGLLLVIIRNTKGKKGEIIVTAESKNLQTTKCLINAY